MRDHYILGEQIMEAVWRRDFCSRVGDKLANPGFSQEPHSQKREEKLNSEFDFSFLCSGKTFETVPVQPLQI